ncbi:MAG: VOC family protein [Oceanospirillaceae bacterium]|nr:VOC family protein [Oceanospirillaceae bacterium]
MTTRIIHTMIRVLDEDRSVDFYKRAFGFEVATRLPFDGFTLTYLVNAETGQEVELTVNHGRTEPYTHGDGYGHIGITVTDLDSEHIRFQSESLEPTPIKEFVVDGEMLARFFFVQDPDGYKIEVLQRLGRYM